MGGTGARALHTKKTIVAQGPSSTGAGRGHISPITGLLGAISKFPGRWLAFLPDNINSSVPPGGRSWEGRNSRCFSSQGFWRQGPNK